MNNNSSTFLQYCVMITLLFLLSGDTMAQIKASDYTRTVPLGGNTWQIPPGPENRMVSKAGVTRWTKPSVAVKTFFRISKPGTLKLWINASAPSGRSALQVTIANVSKQIEVSNDALSELYVGEWNLRDTGYVAVEIKGIDKKGQFFANIADLKLGGSAIDERTAFVESDEGNFFYWGRRGPSVHMGYQVPKELDVKYYYNEITVPHGEDVVGSYYMANGFSGGYFGIQVNSETERRILFSVWSPFTTDNPDEIPEEDRIKLLKKGKTVYTGEFGNEGSGGQSFLRYPWKAGTTYKFLLKGEPVENNHTVYTAWFFAPEIGEWQLIASFSRPKTSSWLTGFHSFLENFSPDQGIFEREVLFSNQWVVGKDGQWLEIGRAKFTADNTARTGFRMDYGGGVKDGKFYLRNCGFFDDYTPVDTFFERPLTSDRPQIDFNKLP